MLNGQAIVITGASSGIGSTLAVEFAGRGARVALVARRRERLERLVVELGAERALAVPADVARYAQVERAAETILKWAGSVQVLVNCAGVDTPDAPVWQVTPSDWERTLAVNLNGVFHCLRAFVPSMLAADYGRIVNISSAMVAVPYAAAYSVSKSAVDVLTSITAEELAATGKDVCINSVDPGPVFSEMNPAGPRRPIAVVPLIMKLATLLKGGVSGRKWQDDGSAACR